MQARRRIGPWLTAVAAVAILALLLWFGDAGAVVTQLASLDPATVVLALALVSLAYTLRFAKWHVLVRTLRLPVGIRRSLQVFLSGLMMVVTPAKVGEVWKSVLLQEDGIPVARSLAAVAVERLVDLVAVALLAAAGLGLVWHRSWVFPLTLLVIAAGLLVLRWKALWGRLADRLERSSRLARFGRFLRTVAGGAHALLAPAPLTVTTLLGIVAWGLEGIALGLILHGLGSTVAWAAAVAAFCAGTLAGVLSFLPGGLGTTEAGMVALLVAQGVPHDTAVAATLLGRACTLGYGALVGAVASLAWPVATRARGAALRSAAKDGDVMDAEGPDHALEAPLDRP